MSYSQYVFVSLSVSVSMSTAFVCLFMSDSVSLFVTCVAYVRVIANSPFHANIWLKQRQCLLTMSTKLDTIFHMVMDMVIDELTQW